MVGGKGEVDLSLQLSDWFFYISESLDEGQEWQWTYCSNAEVLTALFSAVVSWIKSMDFKSDTDLHHI